MLKKILQKLGFLKKKDEELNDGESKTEKNLKKEKKKDNKNSNTPDDIYPLW